MRAVVLSSSTACRAVARPSRPTSVRPFVHSRVPPMNRARNVQANFFKFGRGAEDAGIVGSQGRDDYNYDDVEQYFNYMGFLATEGTYDKMEGLLNSGLHPIDVILLLAASENDLPKCQEILKAGADVKSKDLNGKTALELATKAEMLALLKEYEAKAKATA